MSWKRAASILALILARCWAFSVRSSPRELLQYCGLLPSGDVRRRSLRVSAGRVLKNSESFGLRASSFVVMVLKSRRSEATACMHARLRFFGSGLLRL